MPQAIDDQTINPFIGADVEEDSAEELDFGNEVPEPDTAEPEKPAEEEKASEEAEESEASEDEQNEEDTQSEETDSTEESGEQEEDSKPREQKVPLKRLETKNRKLRAAEARIKELEQQLASRERSSSKEEPEVLTDDEILSKRAEIYNLIVDGKSQEAARLEQELTRTITEQARRTAKEEVLQQVAQEREQERFNESVARLEEQYEFLDRTSNSFDEALTGKIIALRDAYIGHGYKPADALEEAAEEMIKLYKPELMEAAQDDKPKQMQSVTPDPKKKAAAIKKNITAASQQPPEMGGDSTRRMDNNKIDIFSLSDEEFDQLSDQQLKELRGDNV